MKVDIIADYRDKCGESPHWDERTQTLYWTDITGERFYRYSAAENRAEIVRSGLQVSGFAFRENHGLVIVNSSGVWFWDIAGEPQLIVREVEGRRCSLNDCIADPEGRLFTGSTFFDPSKHDYEPGFLMRVELDGSAQIIDDGIKLANGLGFSPDESIFYFVDSAARVIYAYDYSRSNGSIRNRRVFVEVPRESGIPDGLVVDAEGFIWCAHWFGSRVTRYRPDGTVERQLALPAPQISCLTFGGPNLTEMFITSAAKPDALSLAPESFDPQTAHKGGKLFRIQIGIMGKLDYRARIRLATERGRETYTA